MHDFSLDNLCLLCVQTFNLLKDAFHSKNEKFLLLSFIGIRMYFEFLDNINTLNLYLRLRKKILVNS